jgi:hypothetical protein
MRTEPRWPVALTIIVILALLILLPSRVRVFPPWLLAVLGLMAVGGVVGAATHTQNARWASIERWMIASAAVLGGAGALVTLRELIYDMIHGSKAVDGLQMLSSRCSTGNWTGAVRSGAHTGIAGRTGSSRRTRLLPRTCRRTGAPSS